MFSVVHEHRLQELTQNAARIKRFSRLRIVIKALNKTINIINYLICWSVTLLMFIQTLDHNLHCKFVKSENRLAVQVILEIFWTVSLKAHDWFSWILSEWNLSWKIMKYCILSEVCMINRSNSTVSPQMSCIKKYKGWFTHSHICWQDYVK